MVWMCGECGAHFEEHRELAEHEHGHAPAASSANA